MAMQVSVCVRLGPALVCTTRSQSNVKLALFRNGSNIQQANSTIEQKHLQAWATKQQLREVGMCWGAPLPAVKIPVLVTWQRDAPMVLATCHTLLMPSPAQPRQRCARGHGAATYPLDLRNAVAVDVWDLERPFRPPELQIGCASSGTRLLAMAQQATPGEGGEGPRPPHSAARACSKRSGHSMPWLFNSLPRIRKDTRFGNLASTFTTANHPCGVLPNLEPEQRPWLGA